MYSIVCNQFRLTDNGPHIQQHLQNFVAEELFKNVAIAL
jgi:hypothetical protein